jgi:NAD(P)-dependent dehydrogenase (short-subunit alcohol dehydrogenase family)
MQDFTQKITKAPKSNVIRLFKAMWRQAAYTPRCPDTPRLDGKLALVTGGNRGIGYETSKGLALRGADVIILARSVENGEAAVQRIGSEIGYEVSYQHLDLADLDSVVRAIDEFTARWVSRKIDIFVANAGIWPQKPSLSAQGYEIAFATNVLGHHLLIRRLLARSRFVPDARLLMLTGDIYVFANDCTPDYIYENRFSAGQTYNRSKLGNLWLVHEYARRNRHLQTFAVHPGVIASGLGGQTEGKADAMSISTELGAQTSLICATQPGLISGAYYHNTMGRVILPDADLAADACRASEFWELLDNLLSSYY